MEIIVGFIVFTGAIVALIILASFMSRPKRTNEQQQSAKDADV